MPLGSGSRERDPFPVISRSVATGDPFREGSLAALGMTREKVGATRYVLFVIPRSAATRDASRLRVTRKDPFPVISRSVATGDPFREGSLASLGMTREKVGATRYVLFVIPRSAATRDPSRLRVTKKGSLFCHLDERGDERSLSRGIP